VQQRARRPFQRARLRYDATFALEVGYCYDVGVPHSEYLERWSPEDRAKVAAVALEKSSACPSCGTQPYEWDEDPDAYVAINITCPGCMRREIMQEDDTPKVKGTSVRLLPKVTAERLAAEVERKRAEGTLRPRRRRQEQR
jgi:hypothetical protein